MPKPEISGKVILPVKSLHYSILPDNQQPLYWMLREQSWLSPFYLAGGTGLALRIGHRQSIDFDFFTMEDFQRDVVIHHLKGIGNYQVVFEEENTLHGYLNDVKISFFKYPYPLLEDPLSDGYMQIASVKDIGCMKLSAIVSRGSKKDFIDLYFILKHYQLTDLIQWYEQKYHLLCNMNA